MPEAEQTRFWASLTDQAKTDLLYRWEFWARAKQLPPSAAWRVWFVLAGRGFGKTRVGAEYTRAKMESGRCRRFALLGATSDDVRAVMVEGESGLLAVCPPWNKPHYEPSRRQITWPNGGIVKLYSADEPERLRGPQHDGGWGDEPASWRYPEAWDMFLLGLRLGDDPRAIVTGTPKPVPLVTDLIKLPTTHLTTGTTYENRVNLAPAFFADIITKYEGTRLGRQELNAEILEAGGRFFATWNERLHVCSAFPVPRHWKWFGSLDWGTAAPFVFDLFAVSETGRAYLVEEICEANLENWQQAAKVKALLTKYGLTAADCRITADPSMFPPKDPAGRRNHYQIDEYRKAGLHCLPADNDRESGWSQVKAFLNTDAPGDVEAGDSPDELVPMLQVFPGCGELIKSLPVLLEDEKSVEDIARRPKQYDHPADALRYGLKTRQSPAKPPPPKGEPDWTIDEHGNIVEIEVVVSVPPALRSERRKEVLL